MEAAGCWNSDACHSFTQRVNRVKVPSDPPLNPPHIFEEGVMEVNSNGFLICPKCGKKTNTKVLPETKLKHFPLYCNRCKREFIINHNCTRA
jgi:hypothetical protein